MDTTPYKNFRSTFVAYSCVQGGLVGKICRFPTRRNTLLIPVITRFTAFVIVPRHLGTGHLAIIRVGRLSVCRVHRVQFENTEALED